MSITEFEEGKNILFLNFAEDGTHVEEFHNLKDAENHMLKYAEWEKHTEEPVGKPKLLTAYTDKWGRTFVLVPTWLTKEEYLEYMDHAWTLEVTEFSEGTEEFMKIKNRAVELQNIHTNGR